ncbi:MAG: tetratricopeptide repeat protein [Steroidobacteraceae bacterium]
MGPLILSIVIQALLVVHCIKTGRNTIWIWVIVLLPLAGPLAYLAVELVPDLLRSRGTRRAVRTVRKTLDPGKDLRRYAAEARVSGGVAARQRYADELARQGRHDDAIVEYRAILTGLYEHDPNILLALAQAQFQKGDAAGARATLERLIERNPDFKSADGHLLYARAAEAAGDVPKALEEYRVLAGYYSGAEAPVRYARLLRSQGRDAEAQRVLQELLDHAQLAPEHYRRVQSEWLDAARHELG